MNTSICLSGSHESREGFGLLKKRLPGKNVNKLYVFIKIHHSFEIVKNEITNKAKQYQNTRIWFVVCRIYMNPRNWFRPIKLCL